jgi:DNA-directed RNA polymerase specialized sigma24 family protein
MIEPFWDVLRRLSNNEKDAPDSVKPSSHEKNSEDSFLAALPVVRKIVRRRLLSLRPAEAADLEQGIVLRLLKWREKYPEISEDMSPGDWESFAARTAYNETNRHFSKNANAPAHLPLAAAAEVESHERLAGESDIEFQSLALFVWQEICRLTLRQRRALLLHDRQLIVYLLKGGISDAQLAHSIEVSVEEWLEVKIKIPLSDASIARFNGATGERLNLESAIKSIKKARHEARGKLRKLTNK